MKKHFFLMIPCLGLALAALAAGSRGGVAGPAADERDVIMEKYFGTLSAVLIMDGESHACWVRADVIEKLRSADKSK
jgi:hypothetical protein